MVLFAHLSNRSCDHSFQCCSSDASAGEALLVRSFVVLVSGRAFAAFFASRRAIGWGAARPTGERTRSEMPPNLHELLRCRQVRTPQRRAEEHGAAPAQLACKQPSSCPRTRVEIQKKNHTHVCADMATPNAARLYDIDYGQQGSRGSVSGALIPPRTCATTLPLALGEGRHVQPIRYLLGCATNAHSSRTPAA